MKPSIIILTYNSERSIAQTLDSVAALSNDIHVVDSFSADRTREIALSYGANVIERAFENYSAQRNWAIDTLPCRFRWQLHLDADEHLTPALQREIMDLDEDVDMSGFYLARLVCFLGKELRHGGLSPTWHMRLFRSGAGKCETRKYDQHFYVNGPTAKLKGNMIDHIRMPLSEWTTRHNRWSDAEAEEILSSRASAEIRSSLFGNPVEKKRWLRRFYNECPLFVRPFTLFVYRYFIRLGFLDGREGFVFYVLQTFWFRFLVDSKLFEQKLEHRSANATGDAEIPIASV